MNIGSRVTDGMISEPSSACRVSTVFPDTPKIKSYVEAAMDYFVVKPSSSFTLAPPDEWVRWRTQLGSAPSSCSLAQTMGPLAKLYGIEESTTWSPRLVILLILNLTYIFTAAGICRALGLERAMGAFLIL